MTSHEEHSNPDTPGVGSKTGATPATESDTGTTVGSEASGPDPSSDHPGQPSSGSRNPMSRLAGESRALFDDLREWVDLRVQLVQVDVEERIEKAANEIIAIVMVAVLGLFALAFLLHGVAIWLGEALGGVQWGYLIVAAVLGLTTLALKSARPDFVRRRSGKEEAATERLPASAGPKAELPAASTSRSEETSSTDAAESKEGGENG